MSNFYERFNIEKMTVGEAIELNRKAELTCGFETTSQCEGE